MSASGSAKQARVDDRNPKGPNGGDIEDIISKLPDELKTEIISLLPMEDALRTCLLSKSWKRIFCTLPDLSFYECKFPDVANRTDRFAAFIDWTLANYQGSSISTLAIYFNIRGCTAVQLRNEWVNFAVERNVQYLEIVAKINAEEGLPNCLFTCRSLEEFELTLHFQLLKLPLDIYLPNLTRMSLVAVQFPDDNLTERLFSACPMLEGLLIIKCVMSLLSRLTISCPELSMLHISNCIGIHRCIIDIQAPSMVKFHYDNDLPRSFEYVDMSLLWSAEFQIARGWHDERDEIELAHVAFNLLRSSCHARKLKLCAVFNEILMEAPGGLCRLSCFNNLTDVSMHVWADVESEDVLMTLLSKFHHAQELHLIIHRPGSTRAVLATEMHLDVDRLKGILKHLNQLRIDNYEAYPLERGLLDFFLENAKSLTRVTVGIPLIVYTEIDYNHYVFRLNYERMLKIGDVLRRSTGAYPAVSLTILEIPVAYNHLL
ncbi:hypothetical protein vseg_009034 [Gypsophila vaccaria]